MHRRAFLKCLGLGVATAVGVSAGVIDVEQLLWVPGRTAFFDLGAQGPTFGGIRYCYPSPWLTADWIAKEALPLLQHNIAFVQQINREYDDVYRTAVANVGEIVEVRRPQRFLVDYGDLLRDRTALDAYERDALILDVGATA
jgi:hypothetical protein